MNLHSTKDKFKTILGLTLSLGIADFKLRNEGSYLGILWYLLSPLLSFGFLWFIFSQALGSDIAKYPLYLLLGIVMYNYFQMSVSESIMAIRNNAGIIKSIKFPKQTLITAIILKFFISHLIEYIILFAFLMYFNIPILQALLYLPILILFIPFIIGLSLIFSSMTVYFIDFQNIWEFLSRILFFITPVFYQLTIPSNHFYINLLNPLFHFITLAREIVLYGNLPQSYTIIGCLAFSILTPLIGICSFKRLEKSFAERI
ncbi:MAG: ABC transporter permease [Candidatus Woesearchaeota archaeon]